MKLEAGKINKLTVIRKTDIAYLLKNDENEEVFLHVNETNHQALEPDMEVDAFLYYDSKGRLSATLSTPLITTLKPAVLTVVSVNDELGVFMDMGIAKDILLSKDYLPFDHDLWPQVGEQLYVKLEAKSRLVARPLILDDLDQVIGNLTVGEEVSGFIQVIGKIGLFIFSDTGNVILIKNSSLRGKYRLGQRLNMKISYLSARGYEATLIAAKEVIRFDDATVILEYLKKHNGIMPFTANSDSETIQAVFGLSRKAFKRALGHLYKERIIYFENENTYLTGESDESK